ncbi:hypothetical protein [Sphingomonas aerophila]|uniref:Uncharacterized protein n=1 Tax=Sphingomonas aerophila TaxID=1344948 RepID=A0A7W9B9P8_9SPHN|nr:hypothetical protein [Sphingomonas aerophila]MBB5713199.1 hypothetical protein [Sphingomonas aerophila]
MAFQVHTPDELRELLVMLVMSGAGGDAARWREAIGDIRKLPAAMSARFNWRIKPKGDATERRVIRRSLEIVRGAYPYVAG